MIDQFIEIIKHHRFSLSNEARLKAEMESVLRKKNIPFVREYELDKKNRPDFFVDGYAVEVKIGGTHTNRESATSIYKQCERYAAFDEVKGIVLITNRPMGLPVVVNKKPAYYVSLGSSWL